MPEELKIVYRDPKTLKPYEKNSRAHPPGQIETIRKSIREFGFTSPLLLRDDGKSIGAGHGRCEAAIAEGMDKVPTVIIPGLTDEQWRAYIVMDNKSALGAEWDLENLKAEIDYLKEFDYDISLTGFDTADLTALFAVPEEAEPPAPKVTLADKFGVPPFSVLNAREGWWQDRKRAWLALGIKSEIGRGENLSDMGGAIERREAIKTGNGKRKAATFGQDIMKGEGGIKDAPKTKTGGLTWTGQAASFDGYRVKEGTRAESDVSGTSIFDPVMCELAYRWFCPPAGAVLDPFAGGSVRGIVAAKLGRSYVGVDLRPEQIEANRVQWKALKTRAKGSADWIAGDSAQVLAGDAVAADFDFIFSCPPYGDLEVYSDDPADLSTMPLADFLAVYRDIIRKACAKLKNDRFACFVVGDYRDKKGAYANFVSETIRAFLDAGLSLYNEAILVTSVGSLPIRTTKQFTAGRKLGKTHQQALVFLKGDWRKATAALGPVEFGDIPKEDDAPPPAPETPDPGEIF